MPIFFQQDIDESTRLAIWKIQETESFFLSKVPLQREITHPHKRLQHLAGRYLLRYLFPGFPVELIRVADTKKPFLEDEAYHFSISHCGDYAGVIVSTAKRVGMDVELISNKVARIQHKFISEAEQPILNSELSILNSQFSILNWLTLAWSCKEAVFKWYGKGGVDFRDHIVIRSIVASGGVHFNSQINFRKDGGERLQLHSVFFEELCLSYVATAIATD